MASPTGMLAEAYVNAKRAEQEEEKAEEKTECTCTGLVKAINDMKLCAPKSKASSSNLQKGKREMNKPRN